MGREDQRSPQPSYPPSRAHVFISYARSDSAAVAPIVARLRARGVEVWFDTSNIDAARQFRDEIAKAISGCEVLVLMGSSAAFTSKWVRKELFFAIDKNKHVLPAMLERTVMPDDIAFELSGIQYLDIADSEPAAAGDRLLDALSRLGVTVASGDTAAPARRPASGRVGEGAGWMSARMQTGPLPPSASPVLSPVARRVINELVEIPAGAAVIGADEKVLDEVVARHGLAAEQVEFFRSPPRTVVRLPAYGIARYAVSNAEYAEFTKATGWRLPPYWDARTSAPPAGIAEHPVVQVSYPDAEAFCEWRGVRLPSNDEWERAARGRTGSCYPWGNRWEGGRNVNCAEHRRGDAAGLLPVNALPEGVSADGLQQMCGNAWEWVEGGNERMRHSRGGSWQYQGDVFCLAWTRMPTAPGELHEDVGFRYAAKTPGDDAACAELGASVAVPGGQYTLGLSEEQLGVFADRHSLSDIDRRGLQRHLSRTVRVHAFRIRKHLVTNQEYYEFVLATGHRWPSHWDQALLAFCEQPFVGHRRFHPVTWVSYADARAFCEWAGVRLPTDSEWEVAARGGGDGVYPWGDTFDRRRCNTLESAIGGTTRVDAYPDGAGVCGCLDLAGNVHEWVAPAEDGVLYVRGGAFSVRGALHSTTFLRIQAEADVRDRDIGFRCAGG